MTERRCDTGVVDQAGECGACGAAEGQSCLKPSLGFDEDHSVEHRPDRRGSIKRSHRAEGRNFVD